MKHIALNHYSRGSAKDPMSIEHKPKKLYTAPGLGDRVHAVYCAYLIGQAIHEPVTLHINRNHYISNNLKVNKPDSWNEIIRLFPKDTVFLEYHQEMPIQNDYNTIKWLKDKCNIDAEMYYYGNKNAKIDINKYLRDKKILKYKNKNATPEKFVTMQWDGSSDRRPPDSVIEQIKLYYTNQNYRIVEIGRDQTLEEIGHLLSEAEMHVGMDSGMFHIAQMFLEHSCIHIYTTSFISGHVKRAEINGSPIDYLIKNKLVKV